MRYYCLFLLGGLMLATPLAAQTLTGNATLLDQLHLPAEHLTFIENRGQWPDKVAFLAQLEGVNVWITDTGLVYDFYALTPAADGPRQEANRSGDEDREAMWRRGHIVRLQFEGAQTPRTEGRGQRSTYHNYFLGNDSARWASHVALYDEVTLHGLYDGVSLRLYEDGGILRHDVTLAPGITPDVVRVRLEGAEQIEAVGTAPLDRATILGLNEPFPVISPQPERITRAGAPAPFAGGDPLIFSTYIGGGAQDRLHDLVLGDDGDIFIAGRTLSADISPFPTRNAYDPTPNGLNDGYVAQLRSDGVDLRYGTYLGGNGFDAVRGLAYANESVYLTGITNSPNFPTTLGAYAENPNGLDDSFVTQLRPNGSDPVFSTYLGGTMSDGGRAVAISSDGDIVVAGLTLSNDFLDLTGYDDGEDVFVIRLNSDGSALLSGMYLGGSENDEVLSLQLYDDFIYVAGRTTSENFTDRDADISDFEGSLRGPQDAFVARLNSDGTDLLSGRYLGGGDSEGSSANIALALGDDGSVYVTGDTSSDDFPTTNTLGPRGENDAFVTRLDVAATGIVSSTVFGGSDIDRARALDIGSDGSMYVVGETLSIDFPDMDNNPSDNFDAFIVQLQNDGAQILYGTYLGDVGVDGAYRVVVSNDGLAYIAGETNSENFPTTPGTFQRMRGGAEDAFVAAYDLRPNAAPTVPNPIPDQELNLGDVSFETDLNGVFSDPEGGMLTFDIVTVVPGGVVNATVSGSTLTVAPQSAGTDTVTVRATDPDGASIEDIFNVTVTNPTPEVDPARAIPDTLTLFVRGPQYSVDLDTVFVDPNGDQLTFTQDANSSAFSLSRIGSVLNVFPQNLGQASVTVTATDGSGSITDTFFVMVTNPAPTVENAIDDVTLALSGGPYDVPLDPVFLDLNDDDALTFNCTVEQEGNYVVVSDCPTGTLRVTPMDEGTATVTVTATDPDGANVSDEFNVMVTVMNPPPTVDPDHAPPDTTLFIRGPQYTVDLAPVFSDPGDTLDYECVSDTPAVASVSGCADGTLTVTAREDGTATITVTATDSADSSVDAMFDVMVTNPAPTVENPVDDHDFVLGVTPPYIVALGPVFLDLNDDDALTFSVMTVDPSGVVVATVMDSTLTVTPIGTEAATVTVTVTATDPDGANISDEFNVMVMEENLPPTIPNRIPDQDLILDGSPYVANLGEVFEDPNDDALMFTCAVEQNGEVVDEDHIVCTDGTLTVSPVSEGTATVTYTANDGTNSAVSDTFEVTVTEAMISIVVLPHSPNQPQVGDPVMVTATVSGVIEGGSVNLYYRQGGGSVDQMEMAGSGDRYTATIPGTSVTAQGLVYFIEAMNPGGSPVQSAPVHLQVRISTQGLTNTVVAAGGNRTGYRMISVPVALTDSAASTVLAGLGTATDETWRVFELLPPGEGDEMDSLAEGTNGQQRYHEGPSEISMTPGEAFWLISRDGGTFNTGSGLTLRTDTTFTRALHPGWNLIGTPFDFDVPVSSVRLEGTGTTPQLQAYDEGTWRDETSVMKPFQGYALFVPGEADRFIIEPPLETAVRPASPPRATNDAGAQGKVMPSWAVRIAATVGHARDDNNIAMAVAGAVEGHDGLDWFEPPAIGEYVSVSFAAPPGVDAPLTVDARPIPDEGAAWPLAVRSNLRGPVELTFEGLESVPTGFVIWLVDAAGGAVKDLRNEPVHHFASQGNGVAIQMQLIVGSETFAQTTSGFDGTTPTDFHLAQSYPNPFRATTTIQYGLPKAEHVKLEVFDVVGRRVAVLVDDEQEQGYHQAIWSASSGGLELASGVYVYRLQAGSFVATKRMIVVK